MIQFDGVTLSFAGHILFKEATFTLQKGEKCGLVGRNGSGKTTLFRLINGELSADEGQISLTKHYRIGALSQHIRFSEATLLQEAALGLLPEEKANLYKAEKILFGLGFTKEDLSRNPLSFSGGFQLRLHLAKVLIAEPDCLLLDEPTNYLDILSIRWLSHFLKRWQGEFLLVTHDRFFLDKVCTHTMGIHRQRIRKMPGSSVQFFQQILLEEETYEKTRQKQEKKRTHLQSFIDRFGAKASKATQANARKKALEKDAPLEKLNALSELQFHFLEAPFYGKKLLDAHNLLFSYTEKPLIQGFSLDIQKGERIGIIGKNGQGKSTLLRLLGRDLEKQGGVLKIAEHTKIGFFGQTHVERLNPNRTIVEEILLANPDLKYADGKAIAGCMLFSSSLSDKKIEVLSGGEKSRVLLGKIIASPCNLLLLDEPTHHLDVESIEALILALESFEGAFVIVTHSELLLKRLSLDKIVFCEEEKQSLFLGTYEEFLQKANWEEEKKESAPKNSYKESRKERAMLIAQRASVLKPIERSIRACEEKIAALEEKQEREQKKFEEGEVSQEFLKEMGLMQKEIQSLYSELESLYAQYEEKKAEFETL